MPTLPHLLDSLASRMSAAMSAAFARDTRLALALWVEVTHLLAEARTMSVVAPLAKGKAR